MADIWYEVPRYMTDAAGENPHYEIKPIAVTKTSTGMVTVIDERGLERRRSIFIGEGRALWRTYAEAREELIRRTTEAVDEANRLLVAAHRRLEIARAVPEDVAP